MLLYDMLWISAVLKNKFKKKRFSGLLTHTQTCGKQTCWKQYRISLWWLVIIMDQPNSRFHGHDIFSEIGLLPWKTPISVKSVKFREICDFSWILTLLHSVMKVFRVLSTAFVRILLFATCHTSALSSWHVFTELLTYIQSWVLT